MATKVRRSEEHSAESNVAIKQAEIMEIELLFINLQALQPEQPEEMGGFEPLQSHIFSVKFTTEDEFDKVKAWMVANENEQDPSLIHPDKSSLTVTIHSILTCQQWQHTTIATRWPRYVKGPSSKWRWRGHLFSSSVIGT
jgi:hypothetical protein